MRIKRVWLEESGEPVVEVSGLEGTTESEVESDGKPVDVFSSAPGSSVDAAPPVAVGSSGGSVPVSGSSAPLAPDPAADGAGLGDADSPDSSSEVTKAEEKQELDASFSIVSDPAASDARLLMSTPLDRYTVTEGLLFLIFLILALGGVLALFRGR